MSFLKCQSSKTAKARWLKDWMGGRPYANGKNESTAKDNNSLPNIKSSFMKIKAKNHESISAQ